jgi:hypothetical protein
MWRRNHDWQPVKGWPLFAFGLGFGAFLALIFCSEPSFVFLIDHANLLFHEAGHPFAGIFSRRLEPYGGTIGQLFFPVLLAVNSWRNGQPLAVAGASIWFFENWINISRYVADARTLKLPLVGGGDHDWNTILHRWDILQHDTAIAAVLNAGGWIGIGAVCGWVAWRAWADRFRPVPESGWADPRWGRDQL